MCCISFTNYFVQPEPDSVALSPLCLQSPLQSIDGVVLALDLTFQHVDRLLRVAQLGAVIMDLENYIDLDYVHQVGQVFDTPAAASC